MSRPMEITTAQTRRQTCKCGRWKWLPAAPPGVDCYRQPPAWWTNLRCDGQPVVHRHSVRDDGQYCAGCGQDLTQPPLFADAERGEDQQRGVPAPEQGADPRQLCLPDAQGGE
jgi:hypothetical protein